MRKLPSRKLLGAVIAAALLIPNAGFTLGLGEIEVDSALNQKLNAEIELLSAVAEDTETIIVTLASRKEFTRAGLDRPYLLNDLRFKTNIINGVPYIKVSSVSPIREPFLNFLVEIDWPNGHLIREYTVLLDPPVFMTQPASVAPTNQGGTPSNAGFRPTPSASTNVVPIAEPNTVASPRPASTAANQNTFQLAPQPQSTWTPAPVVQQQVSGNYKIKAGDTAWSLAEAMRPDQSITVPQMMVAMLRANPESFINENINGLKRGYILRVPDYNQIASINQQEAMALVREQAALWRQYQQSQAGARPVSAMEADNIDSGMALDGEASAMGAQSDAHLEIVSAGSGSSTMSGKDPTQMSAKELRAELAFAREKVETSLVEKEELKHRVDTLQQHVNKMKGMLSIEDVELAEVQSLGESMEGLSDDAMAEIAAMKDIENDAMTEDLDAGLEAIESAVTDAEDTLFVDETESEENAVTDVITELAPELPIEPQIVETEPDDLLTKFLNNPMMLAIAGGGLLLITALIGLIIKRRKSSASIDEPGVVNAFDDLESLADDIAEETAIDEESISDVVTDDFDSESTMILDSAEDTVITEPGQSVDEDDGPRDDVIAEADVYLAYGIYQQAEELLTQAITDNPDRDDYRVKLAETHYASKDADAFVKVASDLNPRVEDSSSAWKKVAGMGQDLCADNPMFQGSMVGAVAGVAAAVASDAPEMDFDLGGGDSEDGSDLDDASPEASELEFDLSDADAEEGEDGEDEFSLDIDVSELDIGSEDKSEDTSDSEEIDLSDFDLDLDEVAGSEAADADLDLDFGLDDDVIAQPADEVEEIAALDLTQEAETSSASVDLGDFDDDEDFDLSSLDDVDEISTKLDLARAYLDMGDREGTKSILDEVLAEGNDEQKQEASDLMAKLG